ncbi:hypothetical protein IV203_017027 [Nitzschia inconspicua]|uniref:Uncharacterized protein n=1 Tax=Nitzschia inconspicua TaxID=303405 RepID=A0A9K3KRR4_9STRA|nr:hypothetical protein IV203_017027 [Nitzschia inconspicua]
MSLSGGMIPEYNIAGVVLEIEEEIVEDDNSSCDDESVGDEDYLASIKFSIQKEFLARKKRADPRSQTFIPESPALDQENEEDDFGEENFVGEIIDNDDLLEEEIFYYEEQVIEKWFQVDTLPDDLEAACRQLIPIVYKGEEHLDVETIMRRTPLSELYKYLKQHYDYKKDVKKEICEETAEEVPYSRATQPSLQELFQQRVQQVREDEPPERFDEEPSSSEGGEQFISFETTSCGIKCSAIKCETKKGIEMDAGWKSEQRTPYTPWTYDASIAEEDCVEESNSDYTTRLPNDSHGFAEEEIWEENGELGLECSLQDLGGSTRSYIEEFVEGLSSRSFIEEEIIEEQDESQTSYFDEEASYEEIEYIEIEENGVQG